MPFRITYVVCWIGTTQTMVSRLVFLSCLLMGIMYAAIGRTWRNILWKENLKLLAISSFMNWWHSMPLKVCALLRYTLSWWTTNDGYRIFWMDFWKNNKPVALVLGMCGIFSKLWVKETTFWIWEQLPFWSLALYPTLLTLSRHNSINPYLLNLFPSIINFCNVMLSGYDS